MQFTISVGRPAPGPSAFATLADGRAVTIESGSPDHMLDLPGGRRLALFGRVFYDLGAGEPVMLGRRDAGVLARAFGERSLTEAVRTLEGQYFGVLVDPVASDVRLFSDRYAREDVFYTWDSGVLRASTDLEDLFAHVEPVRDPRMVAHMFLVYGWYCPKGLTMYSNVRRLKVGEVVSVRPDGPSGEVLAFEPLPIAEYGDDMLDRYHEHLRFSVLARAEREGTTWVSSSSGWDSSSILALLVDELGPDQVRMVAGTMKYSPGTETINKFEMDKIGRIGEFFGITPEIAPLDFESPSAPEWWQGVLPHFKSRHMYSFPTHNIARIAAQVAEAAGPGQVVFNGETSDSFHNFGFSQFVTFFHTSKSFTEYADKMNCYLYGPTFLGKVLDGTHAKDKVFQIFQRMYGLDLAVPDGDRADVVEAFLLPLFYGGPRLPFARTWANPALTPEGQDAVRTFPFREYMPEALGMTPEDCYAWYIHLYHSFHSQGSTVNVHKHAMSLFGHEWRSPFNDTRVIDLLSAAPESWGRGLDLNHTKYPLKRMLSDKVRFPYELLDEGPHSYLYDVIEGFSLNREILYRSGVTPWFKEVLAERPYRDLVAGDLVDVAYLDRVVDDYLAGREASGPDTDNLVTLAVLCATGWY